MSLTFQTHSRRQRYASVVTLLAYACATLLVACGGGSGSDSSAVSTTGRLAGKLGKTATGAIAFSPSSVRNSIAISAVATSAGPGSTFLLNMPVASDVSGLQVRLNGNDVSARFGAASCGGPGTCVQGTVTATDGEREGKNVITAIARSSDGQVASGRFRFSGGVAGRSVDGTPAAPAAKAQAAEVRSGALATDVCDATSMCPPYLPPTVSFNTLHPGGMDTSGSGAWIQVGNQTLPSVPLPTNCAGATYALVVLDRQTLEEKTTAPESSPQCFTNSKDLKTYLSSLSPADLVIAGTTWFHNATVDDLDTTAVGGSNFPASLPIEQYPAGYMIVGAGQQMAGSAYESYYTSQGTSLRAAATGLLQEDANGNYNFASSDVVEYALSPNDPANLSNSKQSAIAMTIPASLRSNDGLTTNVYTPANAATSNGLWLMVFDQSTLAPVSNCAGTTGNGGAVQEWFQCGTIYATATDPQNAFTALATALNAVAPRQLAVLVSVGSVGAQSQAQTVQSGTSNDGFGKFATALQRLGGTPYAVAGPTYSSTDAYSFIGYVGASNPLSGTALESSTMLAAQGESGFVHGVLQRNNNGLFAPSQASQEPEVVFASKGGLASPDFKLAVAAYQQPVDWPSNSTTTLLPGASSIAGQRAAYRFISHWLLAKYYVKGIQGPHQDDIHYLFSGSSNTFIDYHTFDAANLPFPTAGAGGWNDFQCMSLSSGACVMQAPGDSAPTTFMPADFAAVQQQVSVEVQYLTNVLQFLVTGSTNMKDVIAAGNANVGLALTGAAATILGSKLMPVQTTTVVTVSWQNILSLLGGVASAVADAEGLGELTAVWNTLSASTQKGIKAAVGTANTVGALVGTAAAGGQIVNETSTTHGIPSPFVKFTRTIGELAGSGLQNQMSIGFDVTADSLTSDWARLAAIGPMVVDTSNVVFYAPDQVSQNAAINALVRSSSQSFYLALLPSFYSVQYWPGTVTPWTPPNPDALQPDMGFIHSGVTRTTCTAFYLNPQTTDSNGGLGTLTIYQAITYASMGNEPQPFGQDSGNTDVYVIGGVSPNPGTGAATIPSINSDLANMLFGADQLNISMHQFVTSNGPMGSQGAWVDASVKNPAGHGNANICDAHDYPIGDDLATSDAIPTTTTLSSASSAVLGTDTVLTATVQAGGQPVAIGKVYFVDNGVVIGSAPLAADGTATFTFTGSTLGGHAIQAQYSLDGGYDPSSSEVEQLGVYSSGPDLSISATAANLDVSYSQPSAPIDLSIGSIAGLAGDVRLSCSGLPAGMSCSFVQAQTTLAPGATLNASMTIGPTVVQAAGGVLGTLFLPMLFVGYRRKERFVDDTRRRVVGAAIIAGLAAAALSGCGGGSAPLQETGTKTIIVTATVGTVSRSMPIDVTIR